MMYMLKPLSISLFLLVCACCKDQVEECPCYADQQDPIYKACGPGTVYDLDSDCESVKGMIDQVYTVMKYPAEARADSIQGLVRITFDIYADGTIGNFAAVNDTLGYGLADAAIEALMTLSSKGFCPARDSCSPVVFHYTFPIKFLLL